MISRFTVLCLVLLTIVSTFNGMYIQALGDISAAVVFECGNSGHSRRFSDWSRRCARCFR